MDPSTLLAQSAPADWPSVAPADAGFVPDLAERLEKLIADKRAWNVHGVVVTRSGRLVLERYFKGEDRSRGRALGEVAFGPETLHDLRSVSKSVVGLLYGIALARGKVPPPETKLMPLLPRYADLAGDPGRAQWTVQHVLTMTMGTDWDESSIPYTNPANSEIAMDAAPDRYRYVLGRPVVFTPGTRWVYTGGATALLGRLIAEGTGQSLHAFAREFLFDPMGLGPTEWLTDGRGIEFAASGLRMRPRDIARIGQLLMNGGMMDGKSIVMKEWLARATTEFAVCDETRRYGYQWYMGYFGFAVPDGPGWSRNRLERFWGAYGNGGQRLWVLPGMDLVVAVVCGNYDTPDQWIPPVRVLREVVLAGVR